jgi:hypothetical protein
MRASDGRFGLALALALVSAAACSSSKNDPDEPKQPAQNGDGGASETSSPSEIAGKNAAAGDSTTSSTGGSQAATSSGGADGGGDETPALGGAAAATACDGGFDACEGDPRGEWTWVGTCQDGIMSIVTCPEATFVGEVTLDLPISITSSTFTRNTGGDVDTEIRTPRSCYEDRECSVIYPTTRETETVTEEDGWCVITEKGKSVANERVSDIVIGASSFTDEAGRKTEFCVQGDLLQLKEANEDNPFAFVYTFKRN